MFHFVSQRQKLVTTLNHVAISITMEQPTFLPWPEFEKYDNSPYVLWWLKSVKPSDDSIRAKTMVVIIAPAFVYHSEILTHITLTATHRSSASVEPYVFRMYPIPMRPGHYMSDQIERPRSTIGWSTNRHASMINTVLSIKIDAKINGCPVVWDNMSLYFNNRTAIVNGKLKHNRAKILASKRQEPNNDEKIESYYALDVSKYQKSDELESDYGSYASNHQEPDSDEEVEIDYGSDVSEHQEPDSSEEVEIYNVPKRQRVATDKTKAADSLEAIDTPGVLPSKSNTMLMLYQFIEEGEKAIAAMTASNSGL